MNILYCLLMGTFGYFRVNFQKDLEAYPFHSNLVTVHSNGESTS